MRWFRWLVAVPSCCVVAILVARKHWGPETLHIPQKPYTWDETPRGTAHGINSLLLPAAKQKQHCCIWLVTYAQMLTVLVWRRPHHCTSLMCCRALAHSDSLLLVTLAACPGSLFTLCEPPQPCVSSNRDHSKRHNTHTSTQSTQEGWSPWVVTGGASKNDSAAVKRRDSRPAAARSPPTPAKLGCGP